MNLKHKKILVTGADGFIGSHLVEKLVRSGHDVRALYYKIHLIPGDGWILLPEIYRIAWRYSPEISGIPTGLIRR